MTTNGDITASDTEMAEGDGEVVTMVDVLKEQQDFEDNANAVLGGSDDKECTYSKGYIKRQAIYACMTCCSESKDDPSKRAGICLACGLTCHENHELVELYTKRNFRCDCGNPKFKTPCQFTPNKPELNEDNVYNQNFVGLYCSCSKPYPETTFDVEMIQCIICEDWWHATHLEIDPVISASPDNEAEMICHLCMAKNEFLNDYSDLALNLESEYVDVVKSNGTDSNTDSDDKLTNGSSMDEKLVALDETSAIGIEESSTSNDMETSTTETPNIATPADNNESEASFTEKESKTEHKVENPKISEENESDAPMDMDENKEAEILTEVSSETKLEILPEPSDDNAEFASKEIAEKPSSTFEDKTEGSDDSEENKDKNTVSEDRIEDNSETANTPVDDKLETSTEPFDDKAELASEEKAEEPNSTFKDTTEVSDDSEEKKNKSTVSADNIEDNSDSANCAHLSIDDKSTDVPKEEADNAEPSETADKSESKNESFTQASGNPTENVDMDTTQIKVIEDKKTDENMDIGGKAPEDKETDVAKEEEIAKTEGSSAGTDKPSVETNENSSDEAEPTVTSQDEEMNDISKEKDTVSQDSPDAANKIDVNGDSIQNDSTKIENEHNDNKILPELASAENKRKIDDYISDDISVKKPKLGDTKCVRPKGGKKVLKGATFWSTMFRQKLCTCGECISMYKELSVSFLTDPEDTVLAYETLGKERTAGTLNQYEKGLAALCSLGRIQQIDALTEYNKMRDKLLTFLQSFKEKKEIVTENDIKTFFAGMKPEKRMDGVYFCG